MMMLAAEGLVDGPENGYDDPPSWSPAALDRVADAVGTARATATAARVEDDLVPARPLRRDRRRSPYPGPWFHNGQQFGDD
jgi:hypothetical protein